MVGGGVLREQYRNNLKGSVLDMVSDEGSEMSAGHQGVTPVCNSKGSLEFDREGKPIKSH